MMIPNVVRNSPAHFFFIKSILFVFQGGYKIMTKLLSTSLSGSMKLPLVEENIENLDENGHCVIKRPLVWCSEMDKFLHYLMSERGYNPNELDFKIGIDFGQESLKVILPFYPQLYVLI